MKTYAPLLVRVTILLVIAAVASSPLAGARTTPSACAVAWNKTSPVSLRARVIANKPRGAFIAASVVSGINWTKNGGSRSTSGPGCSIQFILRNGGTLAVWGAWAGGVISNWVGPVLSTHRIPFPANTAVHPDGSVGFHG